MPRITLPILPTLDARIDARAGATREAHPWWPCAEGCDHCCRSLPHLPTITRPEWVRLHAAIGLLPAALQSSLHERIEAARTTPAPVTCPLLDSTRGACLVYEARPIACRSYGFYTERDAGLHCHKVTTAVEAHASSGGPPVVWGNGEAIAADLLPLGEPRSLAHWLRE